MVNNPFISSRYGYQPYSVMQKSVYLFYDNCGYDKISSIILNIKLLNNVTSKKCGEEVV